MHCLDRKLTMQKIPGSDMNYSDHEGVEATFSLQKNVTGVYEYNLFLVNLSKALLFSN